MKIVIYTIIVSLLAGFLLGLLLGLFKKIFYVSVDERIQKIRDALSGANCGGCGYAGCDSFAEAVSKGEAPSDGCVAGGAECAAKINAILGTSSGEAKPKVAFLACAGDRECAQDKGIYVGPKTCAMSQQINNGRKKCAFGCIGFGDCVAACPFDALSMGQNGLPVIDREKCLACGKCAKACPKGLFRLIPKDEKGAIALCSNRSENKPQIKKDCSKGCFKCGVCTKKCPEGAVQLVNGLPEIDRSKCTACGQCVAACPDKVLVLL